MIGLPGNPVSALVVAGLFVSPLIHRYLGLNEERLGNQVKGFLKDVLGDSYEDVMGSGR